MTATIQEGSPWEAVPLSADRNANAIEARFFSSMGMLLEWTGATAGTAVVKLQFSFDKANWFDIATMTKTLAAPAGFQLFELTRDKMNFPWIRASLAKNTETTGAANIRYIMRGI